MLVSCLYVALVCKCFVLQLCIYLILYPYLTIFAENADFTDAYIGDFDIRNLCKNPTLKGENPTTGADTALSAGCLGPK